MSIRIVRALFVSASLASLACDSGIVSKNPPNLAEAKPPETPAAAMIRQYLGEVVNSYPSDDERMVLVLTNLARHAGAYGASCTWDNTQTGTNPNKPPLAYTRIGNIAARFTSKHMSDIGCFQHESCCQLADLGGGNIGCTQPGVCSGPQCGAECTGGTAIGQRYQLLGYTTFSGENIARGYPTAFAAWCGWMNSEGHRNNIYSNHSELGVGMFVNTGGSCGRYWTQAFGNGAVTVPRIPAATAMYSPPNPQNARSLEFLANYYDPSGQAPKRAVVVVKGHCFDLLKRWGHDGNGTWHTGFENAEDIPSGCQPYYFLFRDGDAQTHTYPDQGSLFVPVGNGVTCPSAYEAGQLEADCETGSQECADGDIRDCYTGDTATRNVGECRDGYQVCVNKLWSSCRNQRAPIPEVCDGLDNDCDGDSDEDNPGGNSSCQVGQERGACKAGTSVCRGGAIVCVSNNSPQIEVCDGIDNDCDGAVDDGFPVAFCGVGDCFRKVNTCELGVPQTCTPGPAGTEIADRRDNDCDGAIDNGFPCTDSYNVGDKRVCNRYQLRTPDGGYVAPISPCIGSLMTCQANGSWSECTETGPQPETCDGIDNDCNGKTDDVEQLGWERCGIGGCVQFTQQCRQGAPVTCTPSAPEVEKCDGVDNSCDGTVDEDCTCRVGVPDRPCYTGTRTSLALSADGGVCAQGVKVCVGGDWSGCQNEVTPSTEFCNQLDDDCNGVVDNDCVTAPAEDAGTGPGPEDPITDPGPSEEPEDSKGLFGCASVSASGSHWLALLVLFCLFRARTRVHIR